MWQGHLIRPVPSRPFARSRPRPRRVYTPTPQGFERFLRECVGVPRGENHPACGLQAQPRGLRTSASRRALS